MCTADSCTDRARCGTTGAAPCVDVKTKLREPTAARKGQNHFVLISVFDFHKNLDKLDLFKSRDIPPKSSYLS